ncbi:hypothetical protein AX17_002747 [Amanita inopinata Kibby_2008]|nr:hypothetical protein AX17_002747 [Amanita inopinata Kibby_2008]
MAANESEALAYLRKESLDIYNRLHSVAEDVEFVERVSGAYPGLPLLPNLRCGTWYTDPAISKDLPVYFKSTDGHFNNWSFNLRRANLHLLPFLIQHGGMILVDSTRAGKRMPDALSKTVPIWCSVINRVIRLRYPNNPRYLNSGDDGGWDTALYTPPGSVSPQEHHQIELRLDGWAEALAKSSFNLPPLPNPLRPFWITPSTSSFPSLPRTSNANPKNANANPNPNTATFLPIVCVSASKQTPQSTERRSSGFAYIQGSGDDHELWGMGLDPQLWWRHKNELLSTSRTDLPNLIANILSKSNEASSRLTLPASPSRAQYGDYHSSLSPSHSSPIQTQPTPIAQVHGIISITSATTTQLSHLAHSLLQPNQHQQPSDTAYVIISSAPLPPPSNTTTTNASPNANATIQDGPQDPPTVLTLTIPEGKKGQLHFLQDALPRSMAFIQSHLFPNHSGLSPTGTGTGTGMGARRIYCACDSKSGFDRSTCIALVALQLFFDDRGNLNLSAPKDNAGLPSVTDKTSIQTRLEWIIASEPRANPSRTTLKRVNEYLMSPKSLRRTTVLAPDNENISFNYNKNRKIHRLDSTTTPATLEYTIN